MAGSDLLEGTPYFFCGRQAFREERLLSYIHREHRRGRHLSEILDDPYVRRCGSREFVWATLRDTSLIELLETDIREAFERASGGVLEGPKAAVPERGSVFAGRSRYGKRWGVRLAAPAIPFVTAASGVNESRSFPVPVPPEHGECAGRCPWGLTCTKARRGAAPVITL